MFHPFHAHSGWHFTRQDGGGVRVEQIDHVTGEILQRVDFEAGTWVSIVVAVAAGGDDAVNLAGLYAAAERLHVGTPQRVLVCGVDCHPGDERCNGYCTGKADMPPPGPDWTPPEEGA